MRRQKLRSGSRAEIRDRTMAHPKVDAPLAEGIRSAGRKRDWASMGDEQIVGIARKLIEVKGILNREGLRRADRGLYGILWKRKLLDRIGLTKRQDKRNWGTDEEVLDIALKSIEERGIRSRKGLEKADIGLYQALRRRKLLDSLFAPIRQGQESEEQEKGLREIAEALEEFGSK